jgi:hypothetical protein
MKRALAAAVLVLSIPSLAGAQGRGVFVQAGPLLDILFESSFGPEGFATFSAALENSPIIEPPSDEKTNVTRERLAPGASGAIGVFISPSVSLRVEASFHGRHVANSETSSALRFTRSLHQKTVGITDLSIAATWHQGIGRRTNIDYLGGLLFRRQTNEIYDQVTYPQLFRAEIRDGRPVLVPATTTTLEDRYQSTLYDRGIVAGIDLSIDISEQFSIVPQVRLSAAVGSWNVRPAVSLRWRP